ncbi:hypothetical protein OIDMADRAFT_21649 [Oidiodendron maius Zn]|uniref:DUF899 domain-containing protein n=1 Tax=Oidiodendron maius (strain Zn) TaxID=913774 RepID=A0A0C3G9A2_OIDMZ|nr:hypothetical protein OIDMADRAFT_21649 [Oidiodendron maius Zn]
MPGNVVSPAEWLTARRQLLAKEKAAMKANDALSAELRDLPMVKVTSDYTFTGPNGAVKLADLFDGRRQLIVHHYMFAPEDETGCPADCDISRMIPLHR